MSDHCEDIFEAEIYVQQESVYASDENLLPALRKLFELYKQTGGIKYQSDEPPAAETRGD